MLSRARRWPQWSEAWVQLFGLATAQIWVPARTVRGLENSFSFKRWF